LTNIESLTPYLGVAGGANAGGRAMDDTKVSGGGGPI